MAKPIQCCKVKKKIKKYMGCTKAVLIGNVIAKQAFLKKQEKSQLNNLIYHLKELEKSEKIKFKVSRRKEV